MHGLALIFLARLERWTIFCKILSSQGGARRDSTYSCTTTLGCDFVENYTAMHALEQVGTVCLSKLPLFFSVFFSLFLQFCWHTGIFVCADT
jgi:hypothetical protein